jgi:hypothetical protein
MENTATDMNLKGIGGAHVFKSKALKIFCSNEEKSKFWDEESQNAFRKRVFYIECTEAMPKKQIDKFAIDKAELCNHCRCCIFGAFCPQVGKYFKDQKREEFCKPIGPQSDVEKCSDALEVLEKLKMNPEMKKLIEKAKSMHVAEHPPTVYRGDPPQVSQRSLKPALYTQPIKPQLKIHI